MSKQSVICAPYYLCGICEHYHPAAWDGDCREDQNRYTEDELDRKHGSGWIEVPMPDGSAT